MATNITVKPALGRIVVKLETTEGVSKGGILLPMGKQEITTVGIVVAVSEPYGDSSGKQEGPMFQINDRVVFGKYSGVELQLDRDKFVVMKESDVIATLHDNDS